MPNVSSIENMETLEAYFAGLLDGEGCFQLEKRPSRPGGVRPTIEMNMTCEKTIRALNDRFPGRITTRTPRNANWQPQWRWKVQDKSARAVVKAIRPYVITKREVVEQFVEYWEGRGTWHRAP
jgi:hypothetical protein